MPDPAIIATQLTAIQTQHPDWPYNDQAQASALWGGGHNEHGVFMNDEREVVARHKNAEASVTIAETPCGLFAVGVHFNSYTYGFGHAPSIWGEPYASCEAARRAGIEEILADLDQPHGGKIAAEEIKQVRRQLGPGKGGPERGRISIIEI